MKSYVKPEIDVCVLDSKDIITVSSKGLNLYSSNSFFTQGESTINFN